MLNGNRQVKNRAHTSHSCRGYRGGGFHCLLGERCLWAAASEPTSPPRRGCVGARPSLDSSQEYPASSNARTIRSAMPQTVLLCFGQLRWSAFARGALPKGTHDTSP